MFCFWGYEIAYRPLRTSAPTVADVCVDRCGCLRRPMRMSASTDACLRTLDRV
ncbi:hypothetical protein [Leyella stercorea]|uniref:hypothetical protein n=1 Tax=Leyella stercorea TaxID=363265 RepID=UPI00266DA338|nr:hypothetical protein [Leyella stercorea]